MKKEDLTSMEIMEMLVKFSNHMDERFESIDRRFEKIDQQFVSFEERMNQRFDKVDQRLDYHQTWLERIEKNMATKDQFNSLVGILRHRDVISEYEAAHVEI